VCHYRVLSGAVPEALLKFNQPRSGDRHSEDDGYGSRRSRNLSPLQGWLNWDYETWG
jgi:hypothetical protein